MQWQRRGRPPRWHPPARQNARPPQQAPVEPPIGLRCQKGRGGGGRCLGGLLRSIFGHLVDNTLRVTRTVETGGADARDAKQGPPRSKGVVPLGGRRAATQGGFSTSASFAADPA